MNELIEDKLIELLETFGYPVRRQGSFASQDEYPERFFTFWNNDSRDGTHYDNKGVTIVWDFDVNFYSVDVVLCYDVLGKALDLLKQNGFIVSDRGHDMPSGTTSHIGRGAEVLFLEQT